MVPEVIAILKEMEDLHIKKSAGYGSNQDPLHNFNAVAKGAGISNYYYPILRCMEKLTRAANLYAAHRDGEMAEEFMDVALLMVLAEAMRRQSATKINGKIEGRGGLDEGILNPLGLLDEDDIEAVLRGVDDKPRGLQDIRAHLPNKNPNEGLPVQKGGGKPVDIDHPVKTEWEGAMINGAFHKIPHIPNRENLPDDVNNVLQDPHEEKDPKVVVRTSYPLGKENE